MGRFQVGGVVIFVTNYLQLFDTNGVVQFQGMICQPVTNWGVITQWFLYGLGVGWMLLAPVVYIMLTRGGLKPDRVVTGGAND